jgi:hypothetical protein
LLRILVGLHFATAVVSQRGVPWLDTLHIFLELLLSSLYPPPVKLAILLTVSVLITTWQHVLALGWLRKARGSWSGMHQWAERRSLGLRHSNIRGTSFRDFSTGNCET